MPKSHCSLPRYYELFKFLHQKHGCQHTTSLINLEKELLSPMVEKGRIKAFVNIAILLGSVA